MSAETLHVVTATDENGLVREQEVWADEPEAFRRFDELRAIYGGEFVCIASRKVLGRRAPASDAGTGRPDEADDVGLAVWSALAAKHRTDANLHAITDAVRNILAGAPEPRETQGERERLAEELDYDVVPALFARASEAFYREHDVAAWRRRAEAVEAAARLLRSAPPGEPEQPREG